MKGVGDGDTRSTDMVQIRTSKTEVQNAYLFAMKVSKELEVRLRDKGVDETNMREHRIERRVTPEGVWVFTLNGEHLLTADPLGKQLT